jgi:hypothetical protein
MLDLPQLISNVVGSGFAITMIGWLFTRRFQHELELQKAFLQRASRVHDRQVEALTQLYARLFEAHAYLQRMSASGRPAGEKPEEYPKLLSETLLAAGRQLSLSRLLLPPSVVQECDRFFAIVFDSTLNLNFANDPVIIAAGQRPEFWDRAATIAYKDIPALLVSMEATARKVIHGEPAPHLNAG